MNMSRTTGRSEIVKAAVDSIAQQVTDVTEVMKEVSRCFFRDQRALLLYMRNM